MGKFAYRSMVSFSLSDLSYMIVKTISSNINHN